VGVVAVVSNQRADGAAPRTTALHRPPRSVTPCSRVAAVLLGLGFAWLAARWFGATWWTMFEVTLVVLTPLHLTKPRQRVAALGSP
jgi:hypothetical protein